MSDVTVLQSAANRFSAQAGFAPIAVDGRVGPLTLNATRAALAYLKNSFDVDDTTVDQAAEWLSIASTQSAMQVNAGGIGRFLNNAANAEGLPHVAGPVSPPITPPTYQPPVGPIVFPSPAAASIGDRWRALQTWQKIALGALAGFLLIFLHGRYKRSRGLSGPSTLYLYTYRNKHGSYSDVWAHSADHAREQISRKKDRPSGGYTLSRVTNVPARKVA